MRWSGRLPGTVLSSVTEPFKQTRLGRGYVSFPMTSVPLFFKKEFSVLSHWSPMEHVSCMCPVGTAGTPSPTSTASPHKPKPGFFTHGFSCFDLVCFAVTYPTQEVIRTQIRGHGYGVESQGAFKLLSTPPSGRVVYEVSQWRPPCSCVLR